MRYFIYVLTSLLIIIACATMQSISPEIRTNIIEADYATTFQAVMDYFQERGFVIKTSNYEAGLIDTDYKSGGWSTQLLLVDTRTKVNATLKKISNHQTRVILTMVAEEKKTFGGWQSMTVSESTAKKYYNQYFMAIKDKAEKEQLGNLVKRQNDSDNFIFGDIIKIEKSYVVINLGSNDGLSKGKQVTILHIIEEGKDKLEIEIGSGEIITTKENKSVIKIVSKTENVNIGNKVKIEKFK